MPVPARCRTHSRRVERLRSSVQHTSAQTTASAWPRRAAPPSAPPPTPPPAPSPNSSLSSQWRGVLSARLGTQSRHANAPMPPLRPGEPRVNEAHRGDLRTPHLPPRARTGAPPHGSNPRLRCLLPLLLLSAHTNRPRAQTRADGGRQRRDERRRDETRRDEARGRGDETRHESGDGREDDESEDRRGEERRGEETRREETSETRRAETRRAKRDVPR